MRILSFMAAIIGGLVILCAGGGSIAGDSTTIFDPRFQTRGVKVASSGKYTRIQSYTTPGTYAWPAPYDADTAMVEVGGGGGGGWPGGNVSCYYGASAYFGPALGGNGGYGKAIVTLTPGALYTVVVGGKGCFSTSAYVVLSNGGNSSFAGSVYGRGGTTGSIDVNYGYLYPGSAGSGSFSAGGAPAMGVGAGGASCGQNGGVVIAY
jgi:hypothetical protein